MPDTTSMSGMNLNPSRLPPPPPQLPAKLVAETRIRALQAELARRDDPAGKSALLYELAALTEHRLGDRSAALAQYQQALDAAPTFRPPRSEERRVGKECRRLCRSRWSPYH
jgi:hypothetical protein